MPSRAWDNVDSILDIVVRQVRRALGCGGAAILLTDGSSPAVYPCAASDGRVGPFAAGHVVPASLTPIIRGRRGPVLVTDKAGPLALLDLAWTSELPSSLWLPITGEEGSVVGAMAVFDTARDRFSGDEAPLLESIANQIRDVLEVYAKLGGSLIEDSETGLYCGSYGLRRLAEEIERSARYGSLLSVVLLMIEGPRGGDTVDRRSTVPPGVTDALVVGIRSTDLVASLGQGSFLVVAPETDAGGALALGSRLGSRVLDWADQRGLSVHVGTATCGGGRHAPDDLIQGAARAAAKAGRLR